MSNQSFNITLAQLLLQFQIIKHGRYYLTIICLKRVKYRIFIVIFNSASFFVAKITLFSFYPLCRSLLSMILDENVKAISLGVLQQIDLDLVQCEQFAAGEPIQGLEVRKTWGHLRVEVTWRFKELDFWNIRFLQRKFQYLLKILRVRFKKH